MTDREFWNVIRHALIIVLNVIDRRFGLGKYAPPGKELPPGNS